MQLFNIVLFFSVILLPVFSCDELKPSSDEKPGEKASANTEDLTQVNVPRESFDKDDAPLQFDRRIHAGEDKEAIDDNPLPTTSQSPNDNDSNLPYKARGKINEDFQSSLDNRKHEGKDSFADDNKPQFETSEKNDDFSSINGGSDVPPSDNNEPSANLDQATKDSPSRTKSEQLPKSPDDDKGERTTRSTDAISGSRDSASTDGSVNAPESNKENLLKRNGAGNSNDLRKKLQQILRKFGKRKHKRAHLENTRESEKSTSVDKVSTEGSISNKAKNETDTNEGQSPKSEEENTDEKSLITNDGVHQNGDEESQPKSLPLKEDKDSKENGLDANESRSLKNGEEIPEEKSLITDDGVHQNGDEDGQPKILPLKDDDKDNKENELDTNESGSVKNVEEKPKENSLITDDGVYQNRDGESQPKRLPLTEDEDSKENGLDANKSRSMKNGEEIPEEKSLIADDGVYQSGDEDSQPKILPLKDDDKDIKEHGLDTNENQPSKNGEENPDENSLITDDDGHQNRDKDGQLKILPLKEDKDNKENGLDANEGQSLKNGEDSSLITDDGVHQNRAEPTKNEDDHHKPVHFPPGKKDDAAMETNQTRPDNASIVDEERANPSIKNSDNTKDTSVNESNNVGKGENETSDNRESTNNASEPQEGTAEEILPNTESKTSSKDDGDDSQGQPMYKDDPTKATDVSTNDHSKYIENESNGTDKNESSPTDNLNKTKEETQPKNSASQIDHLNDNSTLTSDTSFIEGSEDDVDEDEAPENLENDSLIAADNSIGKSQPEEDVESTNENSEEDDLIRVENFSHEGSQNGTRDIQPSNEDNTPLLLDDSSSTPAQSIEDSEALSLAPGMDNNTRDIEPSNDDLKTSPIPPLPIAKESDVESEGKYKDGPIMHTPEAEDRTDNEKEDNLNKVLPENEAPAVVNNTRDTDPSNDIPKTSQIPSTPIVQKSRIESKEKKDKDGPIIHTPKAEDTIDNEKEDNINTALPENEAHAMVNNTRDIEAPNDVPKTFQITPPSIFQESRIESKEDRDEDGLMTPKAKDSTKEALPTSNNNLKLLNMGSVPSEPLDSGELRTVNTDTAYNLSPQLTDGTQLEDLNEGNSPLISSDLSSESLNNAEEKSDEKSEEKSEDISEDVDFETTLTSSETENDGNSETLSEERNSPETINTNCKTRGKEHPKKKSTSIHPSPFVYKSMFVSYYSPALHRFLNNRTQMPIPQFFPFMSKNDSQQPVNDTKLPKQSTEPKDSKTDDVKSSSDEEDLSTEPGMWNRALFQDDESSQEESNTPSNNSGGTQEKDFIAAASMPTFAQSRSNSSLEKTDSSTNNGQKSSQEMNSSHLPTERTIDDSTRFPGQTEGDLSTPGESSLPAKQINDDPPRSDLSADLPKNSMENKVNQSEHEPTNKAREMLEEINPSELSLEGNDHPTESLDATDEDISALIQSEGDKDVASPKAEAEAKPEKDSFVEIAAGESESDELQEVDDDENSSTGGELPQIFPTDEWSKDNRLPNRNTVKRDPVQNNPDHRSEPSLGTENKPSISDIAPKDMYRITHGDQPQNTESKNSKEPKQPSVEMKNDDSLHPVDIIENKPTSESLKRGHLLPRVTLKKPSISSPNAGVPNAIMTSPQNRNYTLPRRKRKVAKSKNQISGNEEVKEEKPQGDIPEESKSPSTRTTVEDPPTINPGSLEDDLPEDDLSEIASSPTNDLPQSKSKHSKENPTDTLPSDDNIYQREMSVPTDQRTSIETEDEAPRDVNSTRKETAEDESESEMSSAEEETKSPASGANNQANLNPFQSTPASSFPSFFPPVFSPFMRSFNQPTLPAQISPPTTISTPSPPPQPSSEDDASEEDPSSEYSSVESAEKDARTASVNLESRDQMPQQNVDVAPPPQPPNPSPPVYKSMFVSFLTPPTQKQQQPAIRSSFFSASSGDNPFWSAMQQIVGIGVKNAGALLEGAGKVSEAGFDATKDVFDMVKKVPIVRDVISPVKKFTENGLDVADQTVTGSLLSIGSYVNGQGQTTRERSLGHDRYRYRYPNSDENDDFDARQTRSTPTSMWNMGKYATRSPLQTTQARSVTHETPYSRYRYSYNWK